MERCYASAYWDLAFPWMARHQLFTSVQRPSPTPCCPTAKSLVLRKAQSLMLASLEGSGTQGNIIWVPWMLSLKPRWRQKWRHHTVNIPLRFLVFFTPQCPPTVTFGRIGPELAHSNSLHLRSASNLTYTWANEQAQTWSLCRARNYKLPRISKALTSD